MIEYKGRTPIAVHYKGKVIGAIYQGSKIVWEAISSCFGSGWWRSIMPWRNSEMWKN